MSRMVRARGQGKGGRQLPHEGLEERATLIHLEPIPMGREERDTASLQSPLSTHI